MFTLIGHFENDYRSLCSLIVILLVKLVEGMLPLRLVIKGTRAPLGVCRPFLGANSSILAVMRYAKYLYED